jgi:hypothetical protein
LAGKAAACGFSVGVDAVICFTGPAAGFFLIVALLLVCSVVRFQGRHQLGERYE